MENKLKLLLVADTYYPKVDGTMIFMEQFIERAEHKFDISLLVPNYQHRKDTKDKTFLRVSSLFKLSGYNTILPTWRNLRKIKRTIKDHDLIFIQGPALLSCLAMYYSRKYNKKVVSYVHVISWELFAKFIRKSFSGIVLKLLRKIFIKLYNRCDLVIVPYHDLKEELIDNGVSTEITVARLGVDINRFVSPKDKALAKKSLGINPQKKVIGYVGRVSREKNIHTLVEAFRKLPNKENLFLLIVGGGNKERINEIKELQNCKVTGFVHNVEDYLQAMDIFVMPSLTETTSLATLEAMSSSLPVVATKVGFIKNYLVKDHNGVFFARENPSMLSLKLEKLLEDSELRAKLGNNARKTVAYSLSWERSINKIVRVITNCFYKE